jgi:Aldo/keto reductase family
MCRCTAATIWTAAHPRIPPIEPRHWVRGVERYVDIMDIGSMRKLTTSVFGKAVHHFTASIWSGYHQPVTMRFSPASSLLLTLTATALATRDGDQIPITPSKRSIRSIPLLGFGTWNLKINPQNTTDAVKAAIEAGYIHIDCAVAYGNQIDVGRGIKEGLLAAGKERHDIWVTSKLWNDQYASNLTSP